MSGKLDKNNEIFVVFRMFSFIIYYNLKLFVDQHFMVFKIAWFIDSRLS